MSTQNPSFSIIVPTIARDTLPYTFRSIAPQLLPGDEVLVLCNSDGDWGANARNHAIPRARGTHLVFLDDDDEWVPGALAAMRRFAREKPDRIGIFKMELPDGNRLWDSREVRYGNVGTPMFVVPNLPGKLGMWKVVGEQGPDWNFISETVALQGEPIFCDELTVRLRPRGTFVNRWAQFRYRARVGARV